MPPRNLVRTFVILWVTMGLVLVVASVRTAAHALAPETHNPHIALLGLVEAAAAVLFLIPRTLRLGAVGLLATIGIAFVAHTVAGEFRGDLLVYAAATLFVAVHGPVARPHEPPRETQTSA